MVLFFADHDLYAFIKEYILKGRDRMKMLSKKGKQFMVLTCFLYIFTALLDVIGIYWSGKTIEFVELGDIRGLFWQAAARIVLLIFSYFFTGLAMASRLAFLANGELGVKNGIMKNILRRSFRDFRKQDNAFYLNVLTTDVDMYVQQYLDNIPLALNTVTTMLCAAIMLLWMHPLLLVVALIVSALPMAAVRAFTNVRQQTKMIYSETAEQYTNVLKETIEGYETIRFSGGEEYSRSRYGQAGAKRQRAWSKDVYMGQMSFELLMHVAGFSGIICAVVGGFLVIKGIMSVGMIFAALNYFSSISNGFSNLTNYIVNIRSTRKVMEKLQNQQDMPCPESNALSAQSQPVIEYDNVSFAFGERKLYDGFTQCFFPGGCYAVVGESGSGKSTLIKLLLKYFDNYQGSIRLAGKDIQQLSESEIYGMIGVINQTPYLFNASLYENIVLFGEDLKRDSEEYAQLLRELNLDSLAQRVGENPLGDFGDNISGGERQRINIARALRRHPSILIFDEPTTGLDPENVTMINEFIFNLQNVTRIVITHNWDQKYLRKFDEIIRITGDS